MKETVENKQILKLLQHKSGTETARQVYTMKSEIKISGTLFNMSLL